MTSIFKATTETEAYMVKGLLENEGINVFLKSWQVPFYDSVINAAEGVWGELCVLESDVDKAKEILEGFLLEKD